MPKSKAQAILESAAHVVLLGALAGFVLGPFALGLIFVRELSPWRWLPWPYTGQWPPGDPDEVALPDDSVEVVTQLDRVADLRRDLIEMVSGWAVGQAGQIALVLWLVWPTPRPLLMENMSLRGFDTAMVVGAEETLWVWGGNFEANGTTIHVTESGQLWGADIAAIDRAAEIDSRWIPVSEYEPGQFPRVDQTSGVYTHDRFILLHNMTCRPTVPEVDLTGSSK